MSFLLCLPLRRLIIVLLSFVLIVILEALLLREPGRKCGMVGNHDPRTDLRDYAKKLPLYFLPTLLVSRHNGLFLAIPCAVFSRLNHLDWKWKVRKNEYNESLCIKIGRYFCSVFMIKVFELKKETEKWGKMHEKMQMRSSNAYVHRPMKMPTSVGLEMY